MKLQIGNTVNERNDPFTLPGDAVARTFAIMGQRGSGKSSLATVIAEEMCKASLPWVALDPVGIWWGLRSKSDGSPGGFPVVVFGGERGDLPLEKGQGRKIAEACVAANVFAVIDLSRDSKTTWRTVVKDFCHALQDLRPDHPRHVFLEEAPEFVPQRASHQLGAECKEIVERLVRLGRNWGYGATVITQRPATVDKDVLSQCESLFVMRTSGKHDRKALGEWIEARASAAQLEKLLGELASLPDGAAWYWSPEWMKTFARVQVRRRETFHPGETRTVENKVKSVELVDVQAFVEKVRKQLTKTTALVSVRTSPARESLADAPIHRSTRQVDVGAMDQQIAELATKADKLEANTKLLKGALDVSEKKRQEAERRLDAVRSFLKPQYDSLRKLFEDLGAVDSAVAGAVDSAVYEPWLAKAGQRGCRRMLEVLIQRGEVTRNQLGTLASIASTKSTFRNYLSWLKSNGLVETDGDKVKLRAV